MHCSSVHLHCEFQCQKMGGGLLLEVTEVTARGLSSFSPTIRAGIPTRAEHRIGATVVGLTAFAPPMEGGQV